MKTGGILKKSGFGVKGQRGIKVVRAVTIRRPAEELFSFWENLENLPVFMTHLKEVKMLGNKRSRWVAKGPAGKDAEWEAEIINAKPHELIAWQSCEGSAIPNAGSVRFSAAPGQRGTYVTVSLEYVPPAGRLGRAIAAWYGEEPEWQIQDDLRRFKALMETGEIPSVEGQPAGPQD